MKNIYIYRIYNLKNAHITSPNTVFLHQAIDIFHQGAFHPWVLSSKPLTSFTKAKSTPGPSPSPTPS